MNINSLFKEKNRNTLKNKVKAASPSTVSDPAVDSPPGPHSPNPIRQRAKKTLTSFLYNYLIIYLTILSYQLFENLLSRNKQSVFTTLKSLGREFHETQH